MKKFLFFLLIVLGFTFLCIFLTEKTDVLGLRAVPLRLNFTDVGNDRLISWNRLPYPCFYKVERLSKTTGLVEGEPAYHSFGSEYTFSARMKFRFRPFPCTIALQRTACLVH